MSGATGAASATGGRARRRVLCLNAGSSSLKAARFDEDVDRPGSPGPCTRRVLVERIGGDASASATGPDGPTIDGRAVDASDHVTALGTVLELLGAGGEVDVVAHRVVHGGPYVTDHVLVDDRVLGLLRDAVPFAPLHLPAELELIDATRARVRVPQAACLDTAFHRTMLPEARRLPVPARLDAAGVRRYGFHGLSYEHLVDRLGADLGRRAVLAHLGNGASAAAVLDGRSVDTTMGLTPTGGLVMGTRTGDLDPGVLLHLIRTEGLDGPALERVVDHESGLLGLAGSADVRDVLAAASRHDEDAVVALGVYTSSAARHVAALTTTLGGLDTLVFTAGVGEHSAEVRAAIAARLAHLGVSVEAESNRAGGAVISPPGAPVVVRVEPADEERAMARHALRLTSA